MVEGGALHRPLPAATLYGQLGLTVTAGGITQAVARAGRAAAPTPSAVAEHRFRVQVTHIPDGTVVFDITGDAYHAIAGAHDHDRLQREHSAGGDPHLLEHLAELIAANPTGSDTPR